MRKYSGTIFNSIFAIVVLIITIAFSSNREGLNDDLMTNVTKGNLKKMSKFINDGADVDHKRNGVTPLHVALSHGNYDAAKLLLENDADSNIPADNGITPISSSIIKGQLKITELLIENDAKIDKKDKNGFTPLMYAARYGRIDAVKLLIKNGADVNTRSAAGTTPRQCALSNKHTLTAEILKRAGAEE